MVVLSAVEVTEKKSGALNLFKQSLTMSQSMSAICCL